MTENYLLLGKKRRMIDNLRQRGITDENVLNAFEKVERHRFVELFLQEKAYDDTALKLMNGQTMSHPYTVAFQSQLLQVKKGEKVLEVGTGSGFQAAILSAMGAQVFTIERQQVLYRATSELLKDIDYRIFTCYGDGFAGIPKFAPYDKVIVTCGAPYIPDALCQQLKVGGRMVIPLGEGTQKMIRLTKMEDNKFTQEDFGDFLFVPMLQNKVKN